jgi:hypothetical protein
MNFSVGGLHADDLRDAPNRDHAPRYRSRQLCLRVSLRMRCGSSTLVIGGGESWGRAEDNQENDRADSQSWNWNRRYRLRRHVLILSPSFVTRANPKTLRFEVSEFAI